ncbi:hypothetical protein PENSPDRAFT_660101, partial [Peniophora sp. CONT]
MSLIDRLPPETLGEIMELAAGLHPPRPPRDVDIGVGDGRDDDYDSQDERNIEGVGDLTLVGDLGGAITYSHISRYCRFVALGHRKLWISELGVLPKAVPTLVRRSGEALKLHFSIHGSFERQDIRGVLDFLAESPSIALRVASLCIYERRRNAFERAWLGELRRCALDSLQILTVVGNESEYYLDGRPRPFDIWTLPSLRKVTLTDVAFCFPGAHLTELSMSAREAEPGLEPYQLRLGDLLPCLAACRESLEVLKVDFPGFDPSELSAVQGERIYFPRLRQFHYEDPLEQPGPPHHNAVAHLFDRIRFDAGVMLDLRLAIHFSHPDSPALMAEIMDTLQQAGTPPIFGVQLWAGSASRNWVALSVYSSPGDLGRFSTHSDLLDAVFGARDADSIAEVEETEEEEEEGGETDEGETD